MLKNPHPHPMLYIRGIKHRHLQLILQFMYRGEVSISHQDIGEFISICTDLKVKDLSRTFPTDSGMNSKENSDQNESNQDGSHSDDPKVTIDEKLDIDQVLICLIHFYKRFDNHYPATMGICLSIINLLYKVV